MSFSRRPAVRSRPGSGSSPGPPSEAPGSARSRSGSGSMPGRPGHHRGPGGGAVNIAARVCARAKAGEVLVTDTVRALTRTYLPYTYTSLGQPEPERDRRGHPPPPGRGRALVRSGAAPSSARGAPGEGRRPDRSRRGPRPGRRRGLGGQPAARLPHPASLDPATSSPGSTGRGKPRGPDHPGGFRTRTHGQHLGTPSGSARLDDQTVTRINVATGAVHGPGLVERSARWRRSMGACGSSMAGAGRLAAGGIRWTAQGHVFPRHRTPPCSQGGLAGGSHGGSATPRDVNWEYWDLTTGGGRLWVTSRVRGLSEIFYLRHEDVTNSGGLPHHPDQGGTEAEPCGGRTAGRDGHPEQRNGMLAFADGQLWISDISDALLGGGRGRQRPSGAR